MTPTDLLADVDLFADLTPQELLHLADASTTEDLRRGDVLFHEDDAPDTLYVVIEGRIAIAKRSIDGRESVVALMEPGDLFGEMQLFEKQGRTAEARALEQSQVLSIGYGPIREVYENRPELLWGVVALLAGRLRTMDVALADSVFLDVTGRTAKRLVEMAAGADEFALPMTQEELAGMVGASRERVNKAIASFVRLGWIDQSERRYRIADREQLSAAPADEERVRPRRRFSPTDAGSTAAQFPSRPRISRRRGPRWRAPGVGGVARTVRRAGRIVDEAVVGAGVPDDLHVSSRVLKRRERRRAERTCPRSRP